MPLETDFEVTSIKKISPLLLSSPAHLYSSSNVKSQYFWLGVHVAQRLTLYNDHAYLNCVNLICRNCIVLNNEIPVRKIFPVENYLLWVWYNL